MEILQTLGTSLFIFKVVPNISNIDSLFVMNATCIIPLILKMIFSSSRGLTRLKKFVILSLDVLAICCQAGIGLYYFTNSLLYKPNSKGKRMDYNGYLLLYASTLLMSLGWWETYAEMRFTTNKFFLFIQDQINNLRKYRSKIYIIINPIKIILTFALGYYFLTQRQKKHYMNFYVPIMRNITNAQNNDDQQKILIDIFTLNNGFHLPLLVNIISSALCYFSSRLACKVLMQSIGFALPLSLSTPVTILILLLRKPDKLTYFKEPMVNIFTLEGLNCKFKIA